MKKTMIPVEGGVNSPPASKRLKQCFISLFIITLLGIVVGYLSIYHHLEADIYINGVLSDVINLLILIFIFSFVQTSAVVKVSYLFLSSGIFLWSIGLTFDFLMGCLSA